jgi:hypothetical protein
MFQNASWHRFRSSTDIDFFFKFFFKCIPVFQQKYPFPEPSVTPSFVRFPWGETNAIAWKLQLHKYKARKAERKYKVTRCSIGMVTITYSYFFCQYYLSLRYFIKQSHSFRSPTSNLANVFLRSAPLRQCNPNSFGKTNEMDRCLNHIGIISWSFVW